MFYQSLSHHILFILVLRLYIHAYACVCVCIYKQKMAQPLPFPPHIWKFRIYIEENKLLGLSVSACVCV